MVVKLRNQRLPAGWKQKRGEFFYNCLSGQQYWIPCDEKPKVRLALIYNVPQQFIVLQGESFIIRTPDLEYLDTCEPACTICGDTPYPGQKLLDRELKKDREKTCERCCPEYLCNLCLCEHNVCLACLEPEQEISLNHKSRCRLDALKVFWDRDWQEQKGKGE